MTTVLALARVAHDLPQRRPKSLQRQLAAGPETAARARLLDLGADTVALNRSHSRGVAAVAVSASTGRLGVDVEYADPSRPWGKILAQFAGQDPGEVTPAAAAAAWTFIEAWYKAFQAWPPDGHVHIALAHGAGETSDPVELAGPDGPVWWTLASAAPGFPVSVVSECPGQPERIDLPPVRL